MNVLILSIVHRIMRCEESKLVMLLKRKHPYHGWVYVYVYVWVRLQDNVRSNADHSELKTNRNNDMLTCLERDFKSIHLNKTANMCCEMLS